VARRHLQAPQVLHLAAEVEVGLGDDDAVARAREPLAARRVGRGDVRGAVEVAELGLRRLLVAARELVGELLGADAVVAAGGSGSSATGAPAFSPYIAPITLRCASGGRCSASRCSTLWNSDGSESGPGEVVYSGVYSSAAVESAARRGERRAARRERGPVRRESISFLEWEAAWTEMSWKFGTQL